jgi:hypothetical protein
MNSIVEQLKQLAVSIFRSALSVAPDHNGRFRAMVPFKVGDETKPLMLRGAASEV